MPLLINTLATVMPHVRSGRLRMLGVGSAQRTATLPDAPTIAEQGVPGYEASIWWGMVGPAGLPRAVVAKLNAEINAIVREPETIKWLTSQAADPLTATPDAFAAMIAADLAKWSKVAREAGLTPTQ